MKTLIFLSIFALCLFTTVTGFSTAWPEICRVMIKYTDCTDAAFRIVCGYYGNCSTTCNGPGMTYQASTGKCFGGVNDGEHTWAYAQDMCDWYNGELFIVKDSASSTIVSNWVTSSSYSRTNLFVGGFLFGVNMAWMYVDGTTNANDYWNSGTPTSSAVQCMYTRGTDYKQYAESCTNNYGYVCSADPLDS